MFFGAIGLTAAGWILAVKDENAGKPVKDAELTRDLTVSRVAAPSEPMKEERRKQKKAFWAGWLGFLLCMVPIAIYAANGEHFPDGNLEGMIASLALHIFPWIVLGLGCLLASTVLQEKSMQRESEAITARIKEEKEAGVVKPPETVKADAALYKTSPETARRRVLVRRVLLAAAVCFIIMGIMNGSMKDVLVKAIRICTECVGLG